MPKRILKRPGPKDLATQERRRKAVELRKAGATFDSIARQLKLGSPTAAWYLVKKAYDSIIQEPVDELRKLQVERLNHSLLTVWPKVQTGDERAIETMIRILSRIDAIQGTESPQEIKHSHDGAVFVVEGTTEEFISGMGKLAGDTPEQVNRIIQKKLLPSPETSKDAVEVIEPGVLPTDPTLKPSSITNNARGIKPYTDNVNDMDISPNTVSRTPSALKEPSGSIRNTYNVGDRSEKPKRIYKRKKK